jgi:hypothetical protein
MSSVLSEELEEDVLRQSDLYGAAIDVVVSQKTGEDCFKKMCLTALVASDKENFIYRCQVVENLVKKELGLTSMPNPWRSAKSVLSTAMENKIPVVDSNGNHKGKSKLQQEIKALKSEKDPHTLFEEKLQAMLVFLLKQPHRSEWVDEAVIRIGALK